MTTMVVGASGATGKLLVEQLLKSGQRVKAIVRSTSNIPDAWGDNDRVTIIKENITLISVDEMANHLSGCKAVASCLGQCSIREKQAV
ncbi:SDR family oxidoreductase [Parapedobacter tibetensis]|uniref:SDR family oxidoreductase n=1 Tax=Parapedobacter tibetensis TaxID=2972951 RepID=UPI00214DA684|nr:SDR family oxidoreductase [Parapedobacter tibetensis]